MVNKKRMIKAFGKSLSTYNKSAFIQKKIIAKLVEELASYEHFSHIVELGCGTGLLTKEIVSLFSPQEYMAVDIVPETEGYIQHIFSKIPSVNYIFCSKDIEKIVFNKEYNLIISSSTLQWVKNIEHLCKNVYNGLKQDGVFAFSTFGEHNFMELRKDNGIGLAYLSNKKLVTILQKLGFTIKQNIEYKETLSFESPIELLKHMKNTGTNGLLNTPWQKKDIDQFQETQLTYHPILIIAQKLG